MKNYRLRKEERMAVKTRWRENLVMRAFYEFCNENSRIMSHLSYMPEEVFCASFVIIDSIKGSGNNWRKCIDELYDRLCAGIRGSLDVPEDELMLAVIEVIGVSVIIILQSDSNEIPRADEICQSLMEKAGIDGEKKSKYLVDMHNGIPENIKDGFFDYAAAYMNGNESISDQIAELLDDEESIDLLSQEVEEREDWLESTNKALNTKIMINGKEVVCSLDWLYRFIQENFVQKVSKSYEWYALYKFLNDHGYLKGTKMELFFDQMKEWYKDKYKFKDHSGPRRYNFLAGHAIDKWKSIKKEDIHDDGANTKSIGRIHTLYMELKKKHDEVKW